MQTTINQTEEIRIVHRARGSWKWQEAYTVSAYRPQVLKNGKKVWRFAGNLTRKMSAPQIAQSQFAAIPHGSLHNKPVA